MIQALIREISQLLKRHFRNDLSTCENDYRN